MARPRVDPNDRATQEKLLEAAEAEFGRAGFEGARLEDIARAAGIRRSSLLYHFASKEILYEAVVRKAFRELGARLEASMAEGGIERKVDAAVEALQLFLEQHPALGLVILREWIDGRGPGQAILVEEIVPLLGLVEESVRDAVAEGFPVREAILQIALSALARSAGPPLFREALWGKDDHTRALAYQLFFGVFGGRAHGASATGQEHAAEH